MNAPNPYLLYFCIISVLLLFLPSEILVTQELPEKLQKLSQEEALKLAKRCDQNAQNLYQQGQYAKSLELVQISLKLREKHLPPDHPDIAISLNNLASLYQDSGDYEGAESLFRRTLAILEKAMGTEHPNLITSLNNLGILLEDQAKYEEAEIFFRRALKICEIVSGNEHPYSAIILNNLGQLFQAKGNDTEAEIFFRQALKICEKTLGPKHPYSASSLTNLGRLLYLKGNETEAELLFRQALEIRQENFGTDHLDVAESSNILGVLLMQQKRIEEGKKFLLHSLQIRSHLLNKTFPILTERQQEYYLNLHIRRFLNNALSTFKALSEQNKIYQNFIVYRGIKGRTLRNRTRLRVHPNFTPLFAQLKEARTSYAKLYLSPDPKLSEAVHQKLLKEAVAQKEKLEHQICMDSQYFRNKETDSQITLSEIQKTFDSNTALIDFFIYADIVDWKNRAYEDRLIAFIITKESPVQRIDLGPADPIRSAIKAFRQQLQTGQTILFDDIQVDQYLTQHLWLPLAEPLSEKRLLYLIPDQTLAFIPFEAFPIHQENSIRYLCELKSIAYLSSPQDIIEFTLENEPNVHSLLCLGDVAYSELPESTTVSEKEMSQQENSTENNRWEALLGTAQECQFLMNSFQTAYPKASSEYLNQKKASKALLYEKAVGKRYLHLATHGFFKPILETSLPEDNGGLRGGLSLVWSEDDKITQNKRVLNGTNPMMYSGIVLAGVNLKQEEGILTAEELLGMDLRGTELLTLSACETALGEDSSGQGVSGLRLAAQVAGARSMLLSLWKVDDLGTQLFMQRFYSKLWNEHKGRLQALQETRLEWIEAQRQKKRGPNGEDIYSPKVWASFILSGEK